MFSKSNLKVSCEFLLTKLLHECIKNMIKLGLYWHFVLSAWFVLRFESDFLSVNSSCGRAGVLVSFYSRFKLWKNLLLWFLFRWYSYPLTSLSSLSSSLEKYTQSISEFDGLEANPEVNEFIQYNKLADRPAWV